SEIGVAQPIGAVSKGEFHGFSDEVIARGTADLHEIEVLQDVQDFGDVDAAGARWGETDDGVATISGDEWFAEFEFVIAEIILGQRAAVALNPIFSGLSERAAIKPIAALFGDVTIRGGQIGLLQDVALLQGFAVFEKNRASRVEEPHLSGDRLEAAGIG